jgi:lipoprotein-anchoring transpeptidase ErfK/SrfK
MGQHKQPSRRAAIALVAIGTALLVAGPSLSPPALAKPAKKSAAQKKAPAKSKTAKGPAGLKPGQFEWYPDHSPHGPVAIIISVPKQRVHVYRNGIQIGVSTASTGKWGYDTPTGVFTILQKETEHYSSTYNDAPMPHMERLTWDGIALHAGKLPGYPASHGCVRLPPAFAEKLYGVTQIGTPVIIASDSTHPATVVDPGLLLGAHAKEELTKVAKQTKPVFAKTKGVTSILVSSADKSIYVIQNGDIVAEGTVEIDDASKPLGSNVFILQGGDADGFTWEATGFSSGGKTAKKPDTSTVERITPEAKVQAEIDKRMKPGMVLVTTDQPATAETRSGKDFTIMDAGG